VSLAGRFAELLPLAIAMGTALAALRHEEARPLVRAALGNTARIVAWIVGGLAVLHLGLLLVQD
jgi:hypothetical protein